MAKIQLNKYQLLGSYSNQGTVLTWTPASVADGNQFTSSGKELLLVRNVGASAHNVTITSAADPWGRQGNATAQLVAGSVVAFGPFQMTGWRQSDGNIYIAADHVDIEFSVLVLP